MMRRLRRWCVPDGALTWDNTVVRAKFGDPIVFTALGLTR